MESDFNASDCFHMFDLAETGQITRFQFEEVYNLLQLYPSSLEIELTLYRYDRNLNGKIDFNEFKEALLSSDENYRDLVLRRRAYCTEMNHSRLKFFLDTTNAKLKQTLLLLM